VLADLTTVQTQQDTTEDRHNYFTQQQAQQQAQQQKHQLVRV
jgi:hypothetical protein